MQTNTKSTPTHFRLWGYTPILFNLKIYKTMVRIVDYKSYQKEDGEKFFALVVQGGIEVVKSQETGRNYLTARTARVACTFNEETCASLVGTQLPGGIKKVATDPYEYTLPSGETVELEHRYEYLSEDDDVVDKNVVRTADVF